MAVAADSGNGRWAKKRELPRLRGHLEGVQRVLDTVDSCVELGVEHLTLYCFSTENWNREEGEINGLMDIFRSVFDDKVRESEGNKLRSDVKVRFIGEVSRLPEDIQDSLKKVHLRRKDMEGLELNLAISYGSRQDILEASKALAGEVASGKIKVEDIDSELFASKLSTAGTPDPDLLIRSSGEMRISNYLLWELAYTEIVVVPEYWPDFTHEVLERCILEYQKRERRFGLTTEQIIEQPTGDPLS